MESSRSPAQLLLGACLFGLWAVQPAHAQQIHRNAFESGKPAWVKSGFDAPFEENIHAITDQVFHDGQHSEYISLQAKPGSFIYYQYPTGRFPIGEEMSAGLWLKANRPDIQLMARIVLPNERDPNNLDSRLTTLIRGDAYHNAGRWQRLEIGHGVQLAKQQQQLMQAQLKRPINFTDAYVDNLILNVYAGPGLTEVWIDDLEVGPITSAAAPGQAGSVPGTPVAKTGDLPRPGARTPAVEFNGNQLSVGGTRLLFRAIPRTDTPLRTLRDAGFNTVFLDQAVSPAVLQEAADLGLWIVPRLKPPSEDTRAAADDELAKDITRFADNDAVLFWYLNTTLSNEQTTRTSRSADMIHKADPGRPVSADVWDGLVPYSRILNLVGVHRWPLMTTLELPRYREWLEQRQRLANPGTFTWTWIQTHVPEWFAQILYDHSATVAFAEPVGPQAEQVKLLAYTALAAGCKGLAFWSDRFLADSHQGRDRLLCCALVNQELEMLEPLLVSIEETPQWIETSAPEVKAAVLRTAKGVLVMPIWLGKGAQFVPGQAAVNNLSLVVPQVPQSTQAWEVTPADVRGLRPERVAGGTKINIPEFGLTATIVFTSDTSTIIRFQEQARSRRQVAAQYTYDMAQYELGKVLKIQEKLETQGHTLPDAAQLLADTQARLTAAKERWDSRDFAEAYHQAERSLRPLRILMRAQWDKAVKGLDSPVSSPYAVTFFTLPRHWEFMDLVKRSSPGANLLPGGDFEVLPQRAQDTWRLEEGKNLDDVDTLAKRVSEFKVPPPKPKDTASSQGKQHSSDTKAPLVPGAIAPAALGLAQQGKQRSEGSNAPPAAKANTKPTIEYPHEGKQCAMLQVKTKKGPAPFALERTFLAIHSPAVALQPGSLVQISVWIRITEAITASPDGALFYDSAGGEPLAVRLTEPTTWKKYTLYRRVPSTGTISVTLALTGIGSVYFDDVRIEPLVVSGSSQTVEVQKTTQQ